MEKKSKFKSFLTRIGAVRLSQIWDKFSKPFNFCWKAGLAIFAIVFVIQIGEELVDTCKDHLGLTHYYWGDEDLGKNIEIRHFSNNQAATYNKLTDERLSPKVRWISCVPERDSLTVFCDKEGKRGYLNVNTGKVVIPGQYKHAWHFSEGLAAVVGDNGKVGFINYENELVIPMEFDYVQDYDYLFIRDHCIIRDGESGKYGVIDRSGMVVVPFDYTDIFEASESDDTWYIRKDGKCGLLGSDMNIIFNTEFDNIDACVEGDVAYLTSEGLKQLVAFDGEVIEPFVIDETWPMAYIIKWNQSNSDEYELHPYLVEYSIGYLRKGVLDSRTGRVVIPALYTEISMISKDLISADLGYGDECVMFNTRGERVNLE